MREMKDSGVEWIGEIPTSWRICRLKDYAHIMNGADYKEIESENGEYPVIGSGGEFARATKFLYKGESVLLGRKGTVDKPRYINDAFWTVDTMYYTEIQELGIAKYVYYLCTQIQFDYYQYGSAVPSMTQRDLNSVVFPLPEKTEQKRIADYLDAKCSQIDSITEKQQAIIEKLKEYKLSVITEAVTKGLNPDVEMKDSGIDWIGKIPKHWTISKLKYLFGIGDDGLKIGPFGSAMKGKTLESGPYKIYNQAHLIQNDFSLDRHFVSEDTFEELRSYEVKPDDILFSMMGTIGKCQIMPQGYPKGIMDSHLLKARLNEKILPKFFVYAYDKDFSEQVIQQLLYVSNGTIMNGLNSTILKNVVIALPPLDEQKAIIDNLNKFVEDIDARIKIVTQIVDRLQEYKKSLIYEVVTGKKEV